MDGWKTQAFPIEVIQKSSHLVTSWFCNSDFPYWKISESLHHRWRQCVYIYVYMNKYKHIYIYIIIYQIKRKRSSFVDTLCVCLYSNVRLILKRSRCRSILQPLEDWRSAKFTRQLPQKSSLTNDRTTVPPVEALGVCRDMWTLGNLAHQHPKEPLVSGVQGCDDF